MNSINRLVIQETRTVWDMNQIGQRDIVVIRNIKPSLGLPRKDYYGMVVHATPTRLEILLNIDYGKNYDLKNEAHNFYPEDKISENIQVMLKANRAKD